MNIRKDLLVVVVTALIVIAGVSFWEKFIPDGNAFRFENYVICQFKLTESQNQILIEKVFSGSQLKLVFDGVVEPEMPVQITVHGFWDSTVNQVETVLISGQSFEMNLTERMLESISTGLDMNIVVKPASPSGQIKNISFQVLLDGKPFLKAW